MHSLGTESPDSDASQHAKEAPKRVRVKEAQVILPLLPAAGRSSRLLGPRVELKLALSVRGFLRGITHPDDLYPMIRLLGIFHGIGARAICCSRGRRSFDGSPTKRRKVKHRDCQEHDPARREEGAVIAASEVIGFADEGGPKKRTDCKRNASKSSEVCYSL
mmetsp:Transcript_49935/g.103946  ORF Transcript_49935/g.103946 Transcript_49935/m.103946 type:complete len:162 (+) Transcript_49935:42-527(+)